MRRAAILIILMIIASIIMVVGTRGRRIEYERFVYKS